MFSTQSKFEIHVVCHDKRESSVLWWGGRSSISTHTTSISPDTHNFWPEKMQCAASNFYTMAQQAGNETSFDSALGLVISNLTSYPRNLGSNPRFGMQQFGFIPTREVQVCVPEVTQMHKGCTGIWPTTWPKREKIEQNHYHKSGEKKTWNQLYLYTENSCSWYVRENKQNFLMCNSCTNAESNINNE